MLVTFHTDAHADITMFGDVAAKLIKLMGHTGTIPSAIKAADLPHALEKLRAAVAVQGNESTTEKIEDGDEGHDAPEPIVTLAQRAYPLIQLLEAAIESDEDVMWRN